MKTIIKSFIAVGIIAVCLPVISDISASESEYTQLELQQTDSQVGSKNAKMVKSTGLDQFGYNYELNGVNNTAILVGGATATPTIPSGHSFDTVSVEGEEYDLVEIRANQIFNNMRLDNVTFGNLVTISGNDAFYKATLNNVQMPALKGTNSKGSDAFELSIADDKTIIAIDEITGSSWFRYATIKGSQFPNLTSIKGSLAFESMKEGTTSLEFPELMEISGAYAFYNNNGKNINTQSSKSTAINGFEFPVLTEISGSFVFQSSTVNTEFPVLTEISGNNVFQSSTVNTEFPVLTEISGNNVFQSSAINNTVFTSLQSISGNDAFYKATLNNVQMPALKGTNSKGSDAFELSIADDKTIIAIDEITGSGWFKYATIKGSQFPNLTSIKGSLAFESMKEGTTSLEFPELMEISGGYAFHHNNGKDINTQSSKSTTINGFEFPVLTKISGNSVFQSSTVNTEFPVLTEISGNNVFHASTINTEFPKLETISGKSNFEGSSITNEKLEFPVLKNITSNNFRAVPTLMHLKVGSEVPTTGNPNFVNGGAGKYLTTPTENDQINYILDDQDGKAADGLWFGFKTHDAVVFDSNGGFETVVELVDKTTKKVNEPIIPTKDNHTFEGWFYEDGTEFSFDEFGKSIDTVVGTITVKAKWSRNWYTLKYNNNDGTGVMPDVNINEGDRVSILNSTFTRNGYTFKNWNTKEDGEGTTFSPGDLLDPQTVVRLFQKNITLYAQWIPKSYEVEFDKNTGIGTMVNQDFVYDKPQTLSTNGFTKLGYTFIGWNTKTDGSGVSYNDSQVVENLATSGTFKLYAQWTEALDTQYTVKHMKQNIGNDNYTVFETENLTGTTNEVVTAIKKNYIGFTPQVATITGTIAADGSLILEINYDRNKFDVTFNSGGALTTPATLSGVKYESAIAMPIGILKPGYTLSGWFTEESFENEWNFSTSNVTSNMTLYAKWEVNTYTVEFNSNTGVGTMTNQEFTFDEGQNLTLNTLVKDNFTFVGWNTARDGSGTSFADGELVENLATNGTVTLYAQWSQRFHKVNYDASSGAGVMNSVNVNHGSTLVVPDSQFTKTNSSFINWNTEVDGNGTTYNVGDILDPLTLTKLQQGEITLYAQWSQNFFTISYDKTTGTGVMDPVNVNQGDTLTVPDTLFAKLGYGFTSWNTEVDGTGTTYNAGDILDPTTLSRLLQGNITLHAQWKANDYIVEFNANQGEGVMEDQNFTYDLTDNLNLNKFTRKGYTFVGWNTIANATTGNLTDGQSINNLVINGSVTLYAQWKANNYTVEFNANSGIGTMSNQTFEYDVNKALSTNTFTKEDYTFVGWNSKEDGTGVDYIDGQNIINMLASGSKVLYAQWELTSIELEPSVPTTPQVPLDPSIDVVKPTKPVVEEELEDTGVTTNIMIYVLTILLLTSAYVLRRRNL